MDKISYIKRDTARFCKGRVVSLTRRGMGDREARYGVSFGLSDLGGSVGRDADLTLDQSRCQLVALIEPVRLGDAGGRRSDERICGRLQFRCLKHELQIKHDI